MGMKNDKKEVPDPGARLACAECVNDSYLRELIGRGEKRECSYGHKASGTIALVDLAEYIRRVFKNRYIISKDTGTARIPFTSETNSDVVLNNEGSSVEEIIRRETGAGKELANDLQRVMEKTFSGHDRKLHQRTENSFSENARYIHKDRDAFLAGGLWDELQRCIDRKNTKKVEKLLNSVFRDKPEVFENSSVIIEKNPKTEPYSIYRARSFQSEEQLYEALIRLDQELGPLPPDRVTVGGRLNAAGTSVLYAAEKEEVAINEARPAVGSFVVVACFNVIKKVRFLDVSALKSVFEEKSVFDPDYSPLTEREVFISTLSDRLSKPVMPGDELVDYKITQEISKYLSGLETLDVDGIIYLSTQTGKDEKNIAIFNKSSRIRERHIADEKRIVMHPHVNEARPKFDYEIYEKALPKDSLRVNDNDKRVPKLELDVTRLTMYTLTGITFSKDPDNVVVIREDVADEDNQVS